MRMLDPTPTFTHLVSQIKKTHPDLAYLHVIEPRINGNTDAEGSVEDDSESNDFIRALWAPKILISAGGYTRESALARAEKGGELIGFGRPFLANVSPFAFLSLFLMVGLEARPPTAFDEKFSDEPTEQEDVLYSSERGRIYRLSVCGAVRRLNNMRATPELGISLGRGKLGRACSTYTYSMTVKVVDTGQNLEVDASKSRSLET